MTAWLAGLTLLILSVGCTRQGGAPGETKPVDLVEQGRSVYLSACTACHNVDPTKDGSLGPAIAGSSLELIEHRLISGDYPANYKPKRETRIMVKLPHLKNEIPALHAYLGSLVKP